MNYIHPSLALFHLETGNPLQEKEVTLFIDNVFQKLKEKFPDLIPVAKHYGITTGDRIHLMPAVNFINIPSLQCELTMTLKSFNIGFIEISKNHQNALKAIKEIPLEFQQLAKYCTLFIGTVGSRKTNRDMSYELEISYIPTNQILSIIEKIVDIKNENKNNKERQFGYTLTCRDEVEQFMAHIGLHNKYLEAVSFVEAYQERNKLKDKYIDGSIDKSAKTLIHEVSLVA